MSTTHADIQLLRLFTAYRGSTFDLLERCQLSLAQLHAWLVQPHIQQALAQFDQINAARARAIASSAAPTASGTLADLSAGREHNSIPIRPEQTQRAANALLRLARPDKPASRAAPPPRTAPPVRASNAPPPQSLPAPAAAGNPHQAAPPSPATPSKAAQPRADTRFHPKRPPERLHALAGAA